MEVLQQRGAHVETAHPVRAVVVRDGVSIWSSGTPCTSPWRSAAKPLQLWCALDALAKAGHSDTDLTAPLLAIGASSHSGTDDHLAHIRAVLDRYGVDESALCCGAEAPIDTPTAEALLRADRSPQPIHNDCSGKHAFMLAAAAANGWDLDYRSPSHPLQQRIVQIAKQWTGETPGLAVDGCGVPTLCLSITGMARAWSHLATEMATRPDGRAGRIGWAMARHPELVSGPNRIDLAVAQGARTPMVGKIGAQGVFCIAWVEQNTGIALKCRTGDEPALACAIADTLQRVAPGAWVSPESWNWGQVTNVVGDVVGQRVVTMADGV